MLLFAGELPVLLAVESAAGRHKTVLAEGAVLDTLQQHRLAELRSTGEPAPRASAAELSDRSVDVASVVWQLQAGR